MPPRNMAVTIPTKASPPHCAISVEGTRVKPLLVWAETMWKSPWRASEPTLR